MNCMCNNTTNAVRTATVAPATFAAQDGTTTKAAPKRVTISHQTLDEERALYGLHDAWVEDVAFSGPADGESALKECRDIDVQRCQFDLRYPFWHTEDFSVSESALAETCRAALWYARSGHIEHTRLHGIKAVRECDNITLEDCDVRSTEFGWKCRGLRIARTRLEGEYPFLDSRDVELRNSELVGKYSFQYVENLLIENSVLDTKDAFWHARNVVVRDSVIRGEYLGWYSDGLTLERCRIEGTQPLCYARNLTLIDCEMVGCDLAFENSDVEATIRGHVDSVKNPRSGRIVADSVGEVIREGAAHANAGEVLVRR